MSEMKNDEESRPGASGKHPEAADRPGYPVYTYGTAGITERNGKVPVWLWIVVVSLLAWGVYYLITFWNAPGAT